MSCSSPAVAEIWATSRTEIWGADPFTIYEPRGRIRSRMSALRTNRSAYPPEFPETVYHRSYPASAKYFVSSFAGCSLRVCRPIRDRDWSLSRCRRRSRRRTRRWRCLLGREVTSLYQIPRIKLISIGRARLGGTIFHGYSERFNPNQREETMSKQILWFFFQWRRRRWVSSRCCLRSHAEILWVSFHGKWSLMHTRRAAHCSEAKDSDEIELVDHTDEEFVACD